MDIIANIHWFLSQQNETIAIYAFAVLAITTIIVIFPSEWPR